jgi:hypothetical protein
LIPKFFDALRSILSNNYFKSSDIFLPQKARN